MKFLTGMSVLCLIVAGAACSDSDSTKKGCGSGCPSGFVCQSNQCVQPQGLDGGSHDSAPAVDARAVDSQLVVDATPVNYVTGSADIAPLVDGAQMVDSAASLDALVQGDTGAQTDVAVRSDTATQPDVPLQADDRSDAIVLADASVTLDLVPLLDSTAPLDSAVQLDADISVDATLPLDTAMALDSGQAVDSATLVDTGTLIDAQTCASPSQCPLVWFTFDEPAGTGTVRNNGTLAISNTASFFEQGVPGKVNLAISLNGTSNGILMANNLALDALPSVTAEGWIYYADLNDGTYSTLAKKDGVFLCRANNSGSTHEIQSAIWAASPGGDPLFNQSAAISTPALNTWYHMACVWDGSSKTMTTFWNGSQIGSWTDATRASTLESSNNPFLVGGAGYGENLLGRLDEFKLWSQARTPQQIGQAAGKSWDGSTCN